MRQKKSAISLKVAVVVAVEDIEIVQVFWHFQADAVSHGAELVLHSRDDYMVNLFPRRQGGGNVAIGGQYRGLDSQFLKAVGDLESLVGRAANIGEKCLDGS